MDDRKNTHSPVELEPMGTTVGFELCEHTSTHHALDGWSVEAIDHALAKGKMTMAWFATFYDWDDSEQELAIIRTRGNFEAVCRRVGVSPTSVMPVDLLSEFWQKKIFDLEKIIYSSKGETNSLFCDRPSRRDFEWFIARSTCIHSDVTASSVFKAFLSYTLTAMQRPQSEMPEEPLFTPAASLSSTGSKDSALARIATTNACQNIEHRSPPRPGTDHSVYGLRAPSSLHTDSESIGMSNEQYMASDSSPCETWSAPNHHMIMQVSRPSFVPICSPAAMSTASHHMRGSPSTDTQELPLVSGGFLGGGDRKRARSAGDPDDSEGRGHARPRIGDSGSYIDVNFSHGVVRSGVQPTDVEEGDLGVVFLLVEEQRSGAGVHLQVHISRCITVGDFATFTPVLGEWNVVYDMRKMRDVINEPGKDELRVLYLRSRNVDVVRAVQDDHSLSAAVKGLMNDHSPGVFQIYFFLAEDETLVSRLPHSFKRALVEGRIQGLSDRPTDAMMLDG